jgi:hypothetical protein
MSQMCDKYGESPGVQSMRRTSQEAARGSKLQGDIGERIAAEVVANLPGFSAEPFDIRYHGFDSVFRDEKGNLVLVEGKLTEAGIGSLNRESQQGFPSSVARLARLMQDQNSDQYTQDNAKIGAEIDKLGAENIRYFVVCTDPQTFESTVYERIGSHWESIAHKTIT